MGAMPVPGPTSTMGVLKLGGKRKVEGRTKARHDGHGRGGRGSAITL